MNIATLTLVGLLVGCHADEIQAPVHPSKSEAPKSFESGAPFEGEITTAWLGGTPQTMVFVIKGSKMRFNVPEHDESDYAIFDNATKKLTTVAGSRKTAITIDVSAKEPRSEAQIERTGKTEVIAGYVCELVNVTERGAQTRYCLARGIVFPRIPNAPLMRTAIGFDDGFPLRAEASDEHGAPKLRVTVTKIERKHVDDARLSVPAGYALLSAGGS